MKASEIRSSQAKEKWLIIASVVLLIIYSVYAVLNPTGFHPTIVYFIGLVIPFAISLYLFAAGRGDKLVPLGLLTLISIVAIIDIGFRANIL